MVITYHGLEFFKMQLGDLTVAFNPPSKKSPFKAPRFGADIVLVSMNNVDMNGAEELKHGERVPFIISGPGEYEVKEVFIRGLDMLPVTIYTLNLDNINLCFLGPLESKDLPPNIVEALDDIDILFVPIGGHGVLTPADANKLAVNLEPKLVIPMHYVEQDKSSLKTFLKEAGEEVKAIDKLTIKKKDLEGKEGDVVVLSIV
ncbi:MAG TPA: MBL fold metallo-hydrolase [Candidatus Paceibacterota bacterium]|nr:MBL fold metallo-hydrolase [Candidatus Paceibacterota bacterium]